MNKLKPNLRAFYEFEGNLTDLTTNALNLSVQAGSVSYLSYYPNKDKYIDIHTGRIGRADNNLFSFVGIPFSFNFFTKFNTTASLNNQIITKVSTLPTTAIEYQLKLATSTQIEFYCMTNASNYRKTTGTHSVSLLGDQWLMVTITSSGDGYCKIYFNAVDSTSATSETGTYTGMSNLSGSFDINRTNEAVRPLNLLDRFAIFDKELTQGDINYLYNNGKGRSPFYPQQDGIRQFYGF